MNAFSIHMRLGTSIKLVPRLQQLNVSRYLSYLPREVVNFIVENYVFIGPEENELASQFELSHPYFLGRKGLIILSGQLWRRRPIEKAIVIAHEVAHAINQDKFVRDKRNIMEKRLRMEEEANELAIKWLEKRYDKERLLQICKYSY